MRAPPDATQQSHLCLCQVHHPGRPPSQGDLIPVWCGRPSGSRRTDPGGEEDTGPQKPPGWFENPMGAGLRPGSCGGPAPPPLPPCPPSSHQQLRDADLPPPLPVHLRGLAWPLTTGSWKGGSRIAASPAEVTEQPAGVTLAAQSPSGTVHVSGKIAKHLKNKWSAPHSPFPLAWQECWEGTLLDRRPRASRCGQRAARTALEGAGWPTDSGWGERTGHRRHVLEGGRLRDSKALEAFSCCAPGACPLPRCPPGLHPGVSSLPQSSVTSPHPSQSLGLPGQ